VRQIELHYHRPPDRHDIYVQTLVLDRPDCKVTLLDAYPGPEPLLVAGRPVLEPGAPIVWYVFPGAWYDVGRFHLRDGSLTGYYTDIIAPARLSGDHWEIYDLFLDLWIGPSGDPTVLDRDEFDEAVDRGWIDTATGERARRELERILDRAGRADWPPPVVREIDLASARAAIDSRGEAGS
jgi:predicted RNA-binding protein associated with RNAse of E/G family